MQRFSSASFFPLIAFAFALTATAVRAGDLVEYYHEALDHYFITGDANEMQALDSGVHRGWARTARTLQVFDPGDARLQNSIPVCRFYGNPAFGLDSHFYSATPRECEEVKVRFPEAWLLESEDVFRVHGLSAATGQCPANTKAVYRLYNGRADANHRYTTDLGVVDAMLARGYVLEGTGSGPRPVVFCSADFAPPPPPPAPPPAGEPPSCTLVASSGAPATNSTLTLNASCTNGPTAFQWTNCSSTTTTCATTESTAGTRTYYVNARNASGFGPAASVTVTWLQPSTAPPVCTLSANPQDPFAGGSTVLTATCTQSPSSYSWVGCTATTGNTCQATRVQTGQTTYSVTASNALGTSPPASITLNWQTPPPAGADFCGSYTKVRRIDLVWGGFVNTNDPGGGLEAEAVLAGRIQVPSNATGTSQPGLLSVVEFVDGPAERIMTLSTSACDFRGYQPGVFPAPDPTGANGPMAWGYGINPSAMFALAGMPGGSPKLVPGQIYYVNIRSLVHGTGQTSCPSTECNVRVTVNPPR